MSFFPIEKCDIIHGKFTSHPSYSSSLSNHSVGLKISEPFYLFSTSVGLSRSFSDVNGVAINSVYTISGSIEMRYGSSVSTQDKVALKQLQNFYTKRTFRKIENYNSSSIVLTGTVSNVSMGYINIPHVLYGSEIKPGSFVLSLASGSNQDKYTDDGLGGFFTGSTLIGSIYYQHGIVYFNDSIVSRIDVDDNATVFFSGSNKSYVNVYNCLLRKGELNFSQNSSYVAISPETGKNEITTSKPKTYITSIGLYDKNYNLIGIAKLANPVLNEETTQILFKLKMVF